MASGAKGFLVKDGPAEVLADSEDGSSVADIASRLYLSDSTVRNYGNGRL